MKAALVVIGLAIVFAYASLHRAVMEAKHPQVVVNIPPAPAPTVVMPEPVQPSPPPPPPPPPPKVVIVDVEAGQSGDAACKDRAKDLRCVGIREGKVLLRCSDLLQEVGRRFDVKRDGIHIKTDLRASSIQFTDNTTISNLAICERVATNDGIEW